MPVSPKTARETRVIEANAVALGISIENLMDNSGRAVAEEAARRLPSAPAPVAILAGTGNNGGDGLAAAFYLSQWGYLPVVWMIRPPADIRSAPARHCYERVADRLPIHQGAPRSEELRPFPLVVDAMLGTGQSGPPRSAYADAVRAALESGVAILSIDEPTGLGSSLAVRPKWTVVLEFVKVGMDPQTCGEIVIRSIGIPPEAERQTGPGVFLFYPLPPAEGRAARTGRLVIVGGGPYAGAPALAALAALRAGAERSVVVAPVPAADRILGYSPNLIVRAVGHDRFDPGNVAELREVITALRPNGIVVGMGVGDAPESAAAMTEFVGWARRQPLPLVVDADALAALEGLEPEKAGRPVLVATPNRHEYVRHFGELPDGSADERLAAVGGQATRHGVSLVVKDEVDLLSDGVRGFLNRHHHPAMTVGGVGDVLAGVIGSLLVRSVEPLEAARLATYWVGEAGLRSFDDKSWGLLATDVIERLPTGLREGLRRVAG